MKRYLVPGICAIILLAGSSLAAGVLDIGYGARSISLGRTYAGQKADPYGIFGNPAGLKGVVTGEIVSMYGQMDSDVKYTMLGYVMPTKYGKFFAGYGNDQMGGFSATTLDAISGRPAVVSDFDYRSDLFMLGYENSLNKALSYGFRLKYFSKGAGSLAGYYGSGINADAGLLVEANERLALGITAKNMIPGQAGALKLSNGQIEDEAFGADIGLGFLAHPKLGLYADVSLNKSIPAEAKLGIEWRPLDVLAVRLGAEQRALGASSSYVNGSAGIGLKVGSFGIDYAYYHDTMLSTSSRHFVSISLKTPGVYASEPGYETKSPPADGPSMKKKPLAEPKGVLADEAIGEETEVIEYKVVRGDCLSKIAERFLGSFRLYPKIANDNNIKDPDLIFIDQKLIIKR